MPLVSRWEFPEPPFEPPIGEFVNFCGAFVKIRYIVIVVNIIKMVSVSVVPVLQVDKPGLVFESIWKLEGSLMMINFCYIMGDNKSYIYIT